MSTHSIAMSVTALPSKAGVQLGGRPRPRSALQAALDVSSAIQSSTTSAYAQVDAFTLNVAYVRCARARDGSNSTANGNYDLGSTKWGASRTITLLPGENTVPIRDTLSDMKPGAYYAADFVFWNKWSIKVSLPVITAVKPRKTGAPAAVSAPDE